MEVRRFQLAGGACWRRQRPIDNLGASVRPRPQKDPYRLGVPSRRMVPQLPITAQMTHTASARRFCGARPPDAHRMTEPSALVDPMHNQEAHIVDAWRLGTGIRGVGAANG